MKTTSDSSGKDELFIPFEEMKETFLHILTGNGFSGRRAKEIARIFAENSLDGVLSHGVNRFAGFLKYVQKGYIKVDASPEQKSSNGAVEQWDGNLGPGILNALKCTERVMELAEKYGIGCVALANTNHWLRGGTYGWKAAKAGFVFLGWTNTIANMPAWGGLDHKLGNNPLVLAVPHEEEAVVLDMAMSQFSYGGLKSRHLSGEALSVPGGYDQEGKLSTNPSKILETERVMPTGFWKGASLSLLLDILGTILSGGLSTAGISRKEAEYGVSQVFIAIDISKLSNYSSIPAIVKEILEDYQSSAPAPGTEGVRYPGEGSLRNRKRNIENGIPVNKEIWEEIISWKMHS